MGAVAPVSSWTPEDDLLLKNAVEAGASLESLAKGAVHFSRRFTIRELQERWLSLLYDPEVSSEASERMMEFERSTSNPISKSSKLESLKEGKGTQKRKVESVRRRYHAMKKRICNVPLNQVDLSFLIAPAENVYQNGNEMVGPNNILGDPTDTHLELENTDFDDLHHVFPLDVGNNIDGVSHESDNGDGGNRENYLHEQRNLCEQIPHIMDQNMSLGGNSTVDGGVCSSKELPMQNILADNIETNPMRNSNNMYPGLEGTHVFNSPISECDASFQNLQYPSPPPVMPEWRNMEGMSAMEMAGDSQFRDENPQTGDAFGLPDDATNMPSDYDIVHSDPEFQNHITCDGMKTSSSCPQFDLVALSDTLLNLSDDEMLLMDDDGKEIDKYGLSNLLLDSPADMNDDQMLNVGEMDASITLETDFHIPSSDSTAQLDQGGNELDSSKEQNLSSTSNIKPQDPDFCRAPLCCVLNTEDLEVPNNDHVIFPSKSIASISRRGLNEVSHPALTVKDISRKQANETGRSLLNREMKRFGEWHADSQARGHGTNSNHAAGDYNAKLEPHKSENISVNSRLPAANCITQMSKEVTSETLSRKQSSSDLSDLQVKASNGLNSHFESRSAGIKPEGQLLPAVKKLEVHTETGTADEKAPEPVEEPLLSDNEEQFSDYDSDIPYCSDVEVMIIDGDLCPEDLDLYSSKEVAMYQNEDAKRGIIRLEQSAHASMHRAMASRGAFAVLYGRRTKYFMKKREVLLGRATEDTFVDIDLGKEGNANKISRRQAIIRLDENGEFRLKNLGKNSVLVNDKEVYPGQTLNLHHNCVIQVRDISFIFEKNQSQCLDDIPRRIASQMKQNVGHYKESNEDEESGQDLPFHHQRAGDSSTQSNPLQYFQLGGPTSDPQALTSSMARRRRLLGALALGDLALRQLAR
ncbi:hypothetical protein V2J09_017070 [Rumex salicifolius]